MKEGPGVNPRPPNLEEYIPGENLPDVIDVYVNKEFLIWASGRLCLNLDLNFLNQSTSQLERPIKFVRQYPKRTAIDKGMFNTPSWW
jgi:hypothetical protein